MRKLQALMWPGLSVLAFAAAAHAASADNCLRYNTPVEVTGYFGSAIFPGLPGFEDVKQGDARYEAALLFLGPVGICITADPKDQFFVSLQNVSLLHLACSDGAIYKTLDKLQGSPITLRGKLFNADNANHRAPVLLEDCELVSPK